MLLFTYSTLLSEKVQIDFFGKVLNGINDVVKGYKLGVFQIINPEAISVSENDCHPIATPSKNPNDEVSGAVYEIPEEKLKIIEQCISEDCFKTKVVTESGTQCWMYTIKAEKKLFNYIKNNNDEHIKIG